MNWEIFDKDTCERDKQMIFLYYGTNVWFEGKLINDSKYGLVIDCDYSSCIEPKFISHCLTIELPK